MSSFHEVSLPLALAIGVSGGPERVTDVVRLASGGESRNARWAASRRRWDVGGAVMRTDAAHDLVAFFEARSGRVHGFRFRDPIDWKSCAPSDVISATDQPLGIGDGALAAFQLTKRYVSGAAFMDRPIRKPVPGSVTVAIDGVVATSLEVEATTGVVTFEEPPPVGAVLTAGFAFDTPVRFDADRLDIALVGNEAVRVLRAPLVEIEG